MPRWPLLLLALPAVVAIWSGWVGLGGMCGFGPVELLPGIVEFKVNAAITLPVGMEMYAAYALRAWLAADVPDRAREFARWSSVGALAVGAAGQVAYHLMAAAGWSAAPWPVTIAVSCVPVAVLGMGAALAHLLRGAGVGPVESRTDPVEMRAAVAEAVAEAVTPAVAEAVAEALPPVYMPEIPARPDDAAAVVYRLYGEPGDLLYVGCTIDPWTRFRAHGRRQPWWDEVVASEVIWYGSLDVAAGVEQQAIFTENPVYNLGTARYGYAAQVADRRSEPAGEPAAEPTAQPTAQARFSPVLIRDEPAGSVAREPKPEPAAQASRPARRRTVQRVTGRPRDPRTGQRLKCPCCDQMVSRMTLDRHAERAGLAVRAQSNGHHPAGVS